MLEQLQNSDNITQGLFIAGAGLIGVFTILILFFFTIKIIEKLGSRKK
ncbi:MAG: hypothetical protein PWP10_3430 [Clostridiales bacterium]|jgi:hypothetical protein|nr:hypothetical protein [Eubacteriales bacterium]MDD3197526.1 hypothetical protein [Eubacteriales bacterium]MDD3502469.1 hypothetical protein [Eubacteriales bacterium]MDD4682146.1 hypothetical protein [Eubacteriales bacterium]MDN5314680.1 hypothetical protein [Clostridiales bacterium]